MNKGGSRKTKRFLGYVLGRSDLKAAVSLIEMTSGRLGLHKRFFKSEETFWKAIFLITGEQKRDGELISDAIQRIRGSVGRRSPEKRNEMIAAVDRRAYYEALGVSLHEVAVDPVLTPQTKTEKAIKFKSVKEKKVKRPSYATKDEFYKSWEWRTLRMEVLKEHGRACQCCGAEPGMRTAAGEPVRICVDHIKPISKHWNLRLEKSNLQVLCDECNMGKGNWDETDFRPPSAPDEWIVEDQNEAISEQLRDWTTGRLLQ